MGKTLRIALIAVVVIVVILLIAPFLIPVNKFRPTIEEKASEALGRKVEVGDLSLSLLTGSLTAKNLSIGDDPKFSPSPFLTAKSLSVGVEIMPLIFSKSLNVTGISIDEPEVTLLRNPAGVWNYSSIGGSSKPVAANSSTSSSSSSPTDISVKKLELKNGKIIVGNTNSQKRSTYDHVNVTASDVSMNSKFPVTVSASLPGGGDFKLDGNAGPVDKSDSALTPLDAKIHVGSLNLASTGFLDPSLGLGGLVDLDSTIASQNGSAETKGTLKLSKALLVQGGSPAGVPAVIDYGTKYDLKKNSGVITPSTVKIGSAVAHVNGTYESKGEETVVDVKLNGESMPAKDLEGFLPAIGVNLPKGASLNAGTLSTNLNIKGPTNKLVTDGTIGLFAAKLEGFDLGSKMAPISALTGLKTGKDLEIEKLTTNVHMAPTGLQAENFNAILPALGTLTGGGTLDAKNNLDFKMAATLTGGAIGAMGNASNGIGSVLGAATGAGKNSNCKNGTTIPFMIQGTASDPKFVPDVGGVAAGMLKSQLGCSGGTLLGAGQKGATTPANAVEALSGLFGKKKKP
ncbi:MAG TPA: AsmA family protein [Candidatus Dormibacteraeota bacterium]|jgi:AsmA protein|nr:AsmA family protein [Candidatus Dormibacteraeota bacterium]